MGNETYTDTTAKASEEKRGLLPVKIDYVFAKLFVRPEVAF